MNTKIRLLDVEKEREKIKTMDLDPLAYSALSTALLKNKGTISATAIRLNFHISYPRAARLIDQLEELGYIGELTEKFTRKVYLSIEEVNKIFKDENA